MMHVFTGKDPYFLINPKSGVSPHVREYLKRLQFGHEKKEPNLSHYTNNSNIMSTDMQLETSSHTPEAAREIAHRAAAEAREIAQKAEASARDVTGAVEEMAGEVIDTTKDAAKCGTDKVKDMYHSATLKAGDTLVTSKEFVRRNPVPVVLGAVAFGVAIGYMVIMARRKPTFGERYADEPLVAVREAILGAFTPVAQRVHKGYDTAQEGAEKAMDRVHNFGWRRTGNSLSHQIGRFGNNLKFW